VGPRHGGANEAVLEMLEEIGTVDNIQKFLAASERTRTTTRGLMGFGHRVYKNFDPRAKIIREMCHKLLARLGQTDNPLFELALRLEEIALKDEYFIARKLYPNVDFYSGVIYSALGIPRSMFTVMFAIARTAGWVAHWLEMIGDPAMKIGPAAPALHRAEAARIRRGREALISARLDAPARAAVLAALFIQPSSSAATSAAFARRIGLPSTGLNGDCRMPSSGKTTASTLWRPATKRNAGISHGASRSRSKRSRRSSTSCGMPRSSSRIDTASGVSANRCRLISECADAVPVSTGPTSRGSKSATSCIACSAARRSSAIAASCFPPENNRRRANRALSISVLRGRIEASTTPSRSAALRFASRKSSMPCSVMMRAAFFGHGLAQHFRARDSVSVGSSFARRGAPHSEQ
jgi:hypothetical protein